MALRPVWKHTVDLTRLGLVFLLLAGCGEETTPETLLRSTLDQAQESAENRALGDLMMHISEEYQDEGGRSWKDVRALAQLQFIRNPKIHTFKRVTNLVLVDDRTATVTVLVALAGRPIDNASALSGLRADLMQFDLELEFNQRWQIIRADWRTAELSDFL